MRAGGATGDESQKGKNNAFHGETIFCAGLVSGNQVLP
jgi:hypothetical protein